MAKTQYDKDGRAYRAVTVDDEEYRIDLAATKHTVYQRYGAVFSGDPQHGVRTDDGRVAQGYTRNPILVREYAELWAEVSGENTPEDE